jgi:hypothetical protein
MENQEEGMRTTDVEWARAAVRAMLVRVMGMCEMELTAQGMAARWDARLALSAAKVCRKWRT